VKTRLLTLAIAALVVWSLKRHYADARADDLWWILTPSATIVGLVTDTAFVAVPGEGYLSRERRFAIEKSCAGVNFMIAAFAVMMCAVWRRVRSIGSAAGIVLVSLIVSYVTAVLTNAVRISIAMRFAADPIGSTVTGAEAHRVIGIVVYFTGLMLLYAIVQRIDSGAPFEAQPS
jgi:exosortase K